MNDGDHGDAIWVESTRGADDEPVYLLTWGSLQWYAEVEVARKTALDLVTCAAYAEMMMLMTTALDLPGNIASQLMTDLLRGSGIHRFGSNDTVDLLPVGSTKTGKPWVQLKRGNKEGHLSPAEARGMALQWLEVAEATESDQLITEVLQSAGIDNATQETVFRYLRELRNFTPGTGTEPENMV